MAARSAPSVGRTADKRRGIMRAAEGLFAGRRYHEVTLDEVARYARVGKGTIYNHFRDKEDLFFQLATSGFDELCGLLKERLPAGEGFREQLTAAVREITRFFAARRPLFRVMQAETGHAGSRKRSVRERWLEHRNGLIDAVASVMRRGMEDGEVRRDVPERALASLLLGLLRARVRDSEHSGIRPVSDGVIVELFCSGACGRGRRAEGRKNGRAHA